MEELIFKRIDNTNFDNTYKQKLKDLYIYYKEKGYFFTIHALNRVLGQKRGKGKRNFTKEEILDILNNKYNYIQEDGKYIKYYNNICIIQSQDTKEIVSIVVKNKVKKDWRKI